MKAFLDTNILLDLLLERDGYELCARILQLKDDGVIELCASVLTIVNVAYVYRKTVGQNAAIANLKYLSALLEVLPMDGETIQQALYLEGKDYEDILQYICAARNHCDCVITRNLKDFTVKPGLKKRPALPPAYTPEEFLAQFCETV